MRQVAISLQTRLSDPRKSQSLGDKCQGFSDLRQNRPLVLSKQLGDCFGFDQFPGLIQVVVNDG